jgi:hypothetical protein
LVGRGDESVGAHAPSPRPETDQLLPFFSAIAPLLALGARRPSGPILWQKSGPGILSLRNRDDLKLNQVGPFTGPTLQKRNVVAFYDLKAAAKVRCHPTTDEPMPSGIKRPFSRNRV